MNDINELRAQHNTRAMTDDELQILLLQLQVAEMKKERGQLETELAEAKAKLAEIAKGVEADARDLENPRDGTKLGRAGLVQMIIIMLQMDIKYARSELASERAAHEAKLRNADESLSALRSIIDQLRARVAELEEGLAKERAAHEETKRSATKFVRVDSVQTQNALEAAEAERDHLRARVQELEKHIPERVRRHNLPL